MKFIRKALQHQKEALEKISGEKSIALFWEMRLGKTLVTIRWLKSIGVKAVLIVCPNTVINTWVKEGRKENKKIIPLDHNSTARKVKEVDSNGVNWYATGFRSLIKIKTKQRSELLDYNWEAIVLDESTFIKNPKAKVTKVLLQKSKEVPYKAILTGMPIPESVENYFTQLAFAYGSFMSKTNFWNWRNEYFLPGDFTWHPRNGVLRIVKREVNRLAYTLTRKQANMKAEKIYEERYISLDANSKRVYRKVLTKWASDNFSTKYAVTKCLWLQKICSGIFDDCINDCKAREILNLLKGELKDQKVVIWCRFNKEIYRLFDFLKSNGINVCYINGTTHTDKRKKYIELFSDVESSLQVCIINTGCISFGVDLSFCDTFIYCSNYWSCEKRFQSEDRGINPKKTTPILIIDLLCIETIDQDILDLLNMKILNQKIFQGKLLDRIKLQYD